jgi:hypothetical protein
MRKSVLAALLFGAALVGGITEGQSHAEAAHFTRPFHGHVYTWPAIGTPAYSAGCELTHWWEDGSAVAYCPEDGETWLYDPDGNAVAGPGWSVAPESLQVGPGAPVGAR